MKLARLMCRYVTRVLAFSTLMAMPLVLSAQQGGGPARITYRIVDVKAGYAADFAAVVGEISEIARAAGRPFFHVFERVRGAMPVFVIISPDAEYADLAPLELTPGLISRIQNSQNGSTLLSLAVYGNLGIAPGSVEPSGDFMRVRVRTVSPGNAQAYMDWQGDQMTPALREGGLTDVRIGRVTLGGNSNSFIRFTYSDSVAGGGVNVAEVVGEREFQRILDAEAALLASAEDLVYRYRRDLSFTAN
jgi:hypothetical protein